MAIFNFLCENEIGNIVSVEIDEFTYWAAKETFSQENPNLDGAVIEVINEETGTSLPYQSVTSNKKRMNKVNDLNKAEKLAQNSTSQQRERFYINLFEKGKDWFDVKTLAKAAGIEDNNIYEVYEEWLFS